MVEFVPTGDPKQKFIFNVSTPVGAGAKGSSRADILLVQFYFAIMLPRDIEDAKLYRKIKQTGVCDENLIAAIRAFQRSHPDRLAQDGLVSRAHGARFSAGASWRYWTIVGMNFAYLGLCRLWPRLDQDPRCSPELGRIVRDALGDL